MTGTYNIWLVLLSFVVAVMASYVALDAASRISSSSKRVAKYWLIGGSLAMGCGIWSMHFVGMLAFELPMQMGYDISITLLSMLAAILASGFALFTVNRTELPLQRLLVSGLIMGIGISTMHYTGMAAMRMSPPIEYDPALFILSVAIAIAASIAALWISFNLRSEKTAYLLVKRIGAAFMMGLAITGMHYTGMAAANFTPNSVSMVPNAQQLDSFWMAATIAGCTMLFLTATMLISVIDARLASSTAQLARSLQSANDLLKEEINERSRAEEALQQSNEELLKLKNLAEAANQAKSDFLTNVSHELRTPLTLILAPLEQLLTQEHPLPNWRKRIELIQRNASLLLNRVNDILDFSKAEADRLEVHWEAVNLHKLIPDLARDAAPVTESKSCELDWHIDPKLEAVCLDRSHFEKIFLNLLSNAIKFTPSGGWIRIEAKATEDDSFELAVADSGIGIPEDKLELLFDRFQQVNTSATRTYGGTGIGLALVKELTELMDGTVGVESVPEKGSRFYVHLPRRTEKLDSLTGASGEAPTHSLTPTESVQRHARLQENSEESESKSEPRTSQENSSLPKILVVDDNPDMRTYITDLLISEWSVLTTVNGLEAWNLLQENQVDIVVSDVMMPELDGLDLTTRIKEDPDLHHLPVILVTARGGTDASVSGLETGADDYIAKPFSPAELRARVRAALRMVQIQKQLREKSRQAGMAIVATGILHNLGNVLNGVTVSSGLIEEALQQSNIPKLQKVAELLQEHSDDLPSFIREDNRGQVLPKYIIKLSTTLEEELGKLCDEVEYLRACTDHAVGVITTQQKFALPDQEIQEMISANDLMNKAFILSSGTFAIRRVEVICDLNCDATIKIDSNKALQILLNLLANARHAVEVRSEEERKVWLTTRQVNDRVQFEVRDNGVGILPEHLPKLFNQGFTTKSNGHGFGLHSSANWAHELGGTLTCHSDGQGEGSTFTLEFGVAKKVAQ